MQPTNPTETMPPEPMREALLARADELCMLPDAAKEALQIAEDADCTIAQFCCVVERDVKLATEVLALANSAMFASSEPIANLQQAIVRLGLAKCRNLILASSASSLMKRISIEQEWVRDLLWQHSFTTANACVRLNQSLNLGYHGEEFSAGLLHDFGRLLLAVTMPNEFAEADDMSFQESGRNTVTEFKLLGTDHCELGAWFAQHNGLPMEISSVMRWHHDLDFDHPQQRLTALTAAADHIANFLQREGQADGYIAAQNHGIHALTRITQSNVDEQFQSIADTILKLVLRDTKRAAQGCVNPHTSGAI